MQDTITTFTNQPAAVAGGSQTAPLVFTYLRTDASGITTWTAPGDQNDVPGRHILKRMAQKTKAGIVGRTLHLTSPLYNAAYETYDGSVQVRVTVNAPLATPHATVNTILKYALNLFAGGAETGASMQADFVQANDLPV